MSAAPFQNHPKINGDVALRLAVPSHHTRTSTATWTWPRTWLTQRGAPGAPVFFRGNFEGVHHGT
jgi:hypothetical protein